MTDHWEIRSRQTKLCRSQYQLTRVLFQAQCLGKSSFQVGGGGGGVIDDDGAASTTKAPAGIFWPGRHINTKAPGGLSTHCWLTCWYVTWIRTRNYAGLNREEIVSPPGWSCLRRNKVFFLFLSFRLEPALITDNLSGMSKWLVHFLITLKTINGGNSHACFYGVRYLGKTTT